MTETADCMQCEYRKVCKFTKDYSEAIRQALNLGIKEPFKVSIVCPHYSKVGSPFTPGVNFRSTSQNK